MTMGQVTEALNQMNAEGIKREYILKFWYQFFKKGKIKSECDFWDVMNKAIKTYDFIHNIKNHI